MLVLGAWAAAVDARERRVPDRLVVAAALPIAAVLAVSATGRPGSPSVAAVVAGAVLLAGPVFAVHLVAPTSMGFGDVKLAVVLGAAVGAVDWRWSMAALCVACALTVFVGMVRRAAVLPFAPGLVAGAVVAIAVATSVGMPTWR